jgi:hypothetical protein
MRQSSSAPRRLGRIAAIILVGLLSHTVARFASDSDVGGYFEDTTLQWTGRDWRLRRDDGAELLFPESRNATRLEQAALLGIQDMSGEPFSPQPMTPRGAWLR